MKEASRIINEANVSKVSVAKFLGVSRQMLYNYLALEKIGDLPKDKQTKLFMLFGVENESELAKIKVDDDYISALEIDYLVIMMKLNIILFAIFKCLFKTWNKWKNLSTF